MHRILFLCFALVLLSLPAEADQEGGGTRLLRQPTLSATHVAFAYGGDLWVVDRAGGAARRLTSTAGRSRAIRTSRGTVVRIAFTSNRPGLPEVYVVSASGGHAGAADVGTRRHRSPGVGRRTASGCSMRPSVRRAPVGHERLWTVPARGRTVGEGADPMGARRLVTRRTAGGW